MDILIIEDDSFKYSKIISLVKRILPNTKETKFDNVSDTIQYIRQQRPQKIILDMSLPSHAAIAGKGSPISMPSGGIEIILELRSLGMTNIPIIILTQYPYVEVEYEFYSISDSGQVIMNLYGLSNITVVHYDNESDAWSIETQLFLEG